MGIDNKDELDDELVKSLERLVEEETSVAKAFVDNQKESSAENTAAKDSQDTDIEMGKTKVIPKVTTDMLTKSDDDVQKTGVYNVDEVRDNIRNIPVKNSDSGVNLDVDLDVNSDVSSDIDSDKHADSDKHVAGGTASDDKKKKIIIGVSCGIAALLVLIGIITGVVIHNRSKESYKYNYEKVDIPKKYIVVICFIAIILVALDYYTIEKSIVSDSQDIRLFSVIFFFFSIVMIIVMFDLVLKLAENYQQKQELALLELQNEMNVKAEKNTEQTFNLWRSSIHDYKHKVLVIKHWLDEGKIEELKDFIENESETLAQKIYYIKTGNEVVDAIINTKQNLAEKKGINFSVNVKIPPECIVSDIDFVCIFGNLIDNAIEACETQSEKRIEIIVKEIKKLLIIKVINSYKGKLPDKLSTTKKEKRFHGIGLKNVKSILEKYDGTYQMIKEDDEVITKIMILNKKR